MNPGRPRDLGDECDRGEVITRYPAPRKAATPITVNNVVSSIPNAPPVTRPASAPATTNGTNRPPTPPPATAVDVPTNRSSSTANTSPRHRDEDRGAPRDRAVARPGGHVGAGEHPREHEQCHEHATCKWHTEPIRIRIAIRLAARNIHANTRAPNPAEERRAAGPPRGPGRRSSGCPSPPRGRAVAVNHNEHEIARRRTRPAGRCRGTRRARSSWYGTSTRTPLPSPVH